MWGTLIEKAWAKAFSNYSALKRGGFSTQPLRAFNGAPVQSYNFRKYKPWEMFVSINNSKVYGYFHNLETEHSYDNSGDTKVNHCGITFSHAYSLLDTF